MVHCSSSFIAEMMSNFCNNSYLTSLSCCYAGNGITLQLIRRNQQCNVSEALAPIDINLQYDFNYQEFTFLPNEVQVLPVSFKIISKKIL